MYRWDTHNNDGSEVGLVLSNLQLAYIAIYTGNTLRVECFNVREREPALSRFLTADGQQGCVVKL